MSELTTRTIEITLEECVVHAQDRKDELESKVDKISQEIDDLREGYDGDEDFSPPQQLVQSRQQARSEIERQKEVVNRTLLAIDHHFLPDGGDVDDIEDTTMVFEELNIGDGVDMSYDVGIDESSTQEEVKAAEREMMGMYLNRMVQKTPDPIPDDMTDLPMAVGEGIFNVLDRRLEEGNTDLSVSQIRSRTETN